MVINQLSRRSATRAAFTLMEMLVVVAIIVMLAGLGGYYFIQTQRNSQVKAAEIQCRTIIDACEKFAAQNNTRYPENLEELITGPGGPYIKHLDALKDPWGEFYNYQQPVPGASTMPHVWTRNPFDGSTIGNSPVN